MGRELHCGRHVFALDRPLVLGILNVTPDSFSDGGRYDDFARALDHARQMAADGAALIDVGGESTRPGAAPVAEAEEIARVIPLVEAMTAEGMAVSVDTRKPGVMRVPRSTRPPLSSYASTLTPLKLSMPWTPRTSSRHAATTGVGAGKPKLSSGSP